MDNVQEIRYDKPSLMPPYASMNQKDFDDVVAYLNSLEGGAMRTDATRAWSSPRC